MVAYSDTAIAFFGAYFKVQQLIVMTVNGLIQGCLPIMRFNYGARKQRRLHSAFRYGTALVSGMMILGTLTVILFPAQLLGLFTASESMRSFGISAMRIMAVSYLFCGWSTMISTYLQATEQVSPSMLIQLLRQFLLLISFMWGLEKLLKITGIWLSFPVTETATFVLALLIFRAGRKKKRFAAVQKHSKNRKRRDDMEIHIKKG
ncbi:MAG: MATE family efflux transporter [Ruminococcus sp.]